MTAMELNPDIPVERREEMQEHYAWVRDQSLAAVNETYGYTPEWSESARRPV